MNSPRSSIHSLVSQIKREIFSFSDQDFYKFVSPSAYDTAWLAMVSDPVKTDHPMFKSCLSWILNNQNDGGFWGETVPDDGRPTIDTLLATLSCLLALKRWNVGEDNIRKGLEFFNSKAEIILSENYHHLPNWFTIVFPGMLEMAETKGLDLILPQPPNHVFSDVQLKRQQILNMEHLEEDSGKYYDIPLLSYLECLPPSCQVDQHKILNNLSEDGSLFQSPSATARAYMETGNIKCLEYLNSLVGRCPNGVPSKYPMDENLIKLSMVDHVQRLGLAEHFNEELNHILKQIYSEYLDEFKCTKEAHLLPTKLFKDALAFRLLRMQGYQVNPSSFCWFLQQPNFLEYIEKNYENHTSLLYAVYRATDLMFSGELELEESRLFSRKLLVKSMSTIGNIRDNHISISPGLKKVIELELAFPWISRMDHLDHRTWIEETKNNPLWIGKASFYRLSCLNDEKLMQLAADNYKLRQSIYAQEVEELKQWSTDSGLAEIGFGRDKTMYSYFAIAASTCLPHDSIARLLAAKISALITVADDFYDMEGHLPELQILTDAVERWDGKNLTGHSKTIFDALDDLVKKTALSYSFQQEGTIFMEIFKDLWKESFLSWMVERRWSETGHLPSMADYLEMGMISIAAHTIALPSSCFIGQHLTMDNIKGKNITKLLMVIARLLNDTQSYQKEIIVGKMNMVSLHQKENPELRIEDSVAFVRNIVDEKTKQLLQIALTDPHDEDGDENINNYNMPKAFRHLHLSCMRVFYMFFSTSNLFDTEKELMDDIKKAIYIPPHRTPQNPLHIRVKPLPPPSLDPREKKEIFQTSACFRPKIKVSLKYQAAVKKQVLLPRNFKNPVISIVNNSGRAANYVPLKF